MRRTMKSWQIANQIIGIVGYHLYAPYPATPAHGLGASFLGVQKTGSQNILITWQRASFNKTALRLPLQRSLSPFLSEVSVEAADEKIKVRRMGLWLSSWESRGLLSITQTPATAGVMLAISYTRAAVHKESRPRDFCGNTLRRSGFRSETTVWEAEGTASGNTVPQLAWTATLNSTECLHFSRLSLPHAPGLCRWPLFVLDNRTRPRRFIFSSLDDVTYRHHIAFISITSLNSSFKRQLMLEN